MGKRYKEISPLLAADVLLAGENFYLCYDCDDGTYYLRLGRPSAGVPCCQCCDFDSVPQELLDGIKRAEFDTWEEYYQAIADRVDTLAKTGGLGEVIDLLRSRLKAEGKIIKILRRWSHGIYR